MGKCSHATWLALAVAVLSFHPAARGVPATVAEHRLTISIDAEAGVLRGQDVLTLPSDAPVVLELDRDLALSLDGGGVLERLGTPVGTLARYRLRPSTHPEALVLRFHGPLPGRSARGFVALSPDDGWYPRLRAQGLRRYQIETRHPPGWHVVTTGAPEPGTLSVPVTGIHLLAGPYEVSRRSVGSVVVEVLLRDPDPALAQRYLAASAGYLEGYARLFGDYPYPRFSVVENDRPTGLGYPGYTLLGGEVMRLPFILHTSLPHEILHSWWGNGVFADVRHGNWSEGLTTYLADHALGEARGEGARHRLDALARLRHVHERGRLTSLTRFRQRHDRDSQTLGYDRALMVFHMIRQRLGTAVFIERLRDLFRQGRFRHVDAAEVLATLDPEVPWFEDWWRPAGLPVLELACCRVTTVGAGETVQGTLSWRGGASPVPVVLALGLEGETAARRHIVTVAGPETPFSLTVPGRIAHLEADPEAGLLRLAAIDELPASLSDVLSAPRRVAITGEGSPGAAAEVARALDVTLLPPGAMPGPDVTAALVLGTPPGELSAPGPAPVAPGEHLVEAIRIPAPASSPVLRSLLYLRLDPELGPAGVTRLARVLPRYGRHARVVFAGPDARPRTRTQANRPHTHPLAWARGPAATRRPLPPGPRLLDPGAP